MNKQQTALVRALLSLAPKKRPCDAFTNATISANMIRLWISSCSEIEVFISADNIAACCGNTGVIQAQVLRQHIGKAREASIEVFQTGDDPPTTMIAVRHSTTLLSASVTDEQPLVSTPQAYSLAVAEIDRSAIDVMYEASKVASTDTTRAHLNGVWFHEGHVYACDGHRLDKRPAQTTCQWPLHLPLLLCNILAKIGVVGRSVVTREKMGDNWSYEFHTTTSHAAVRFRWYVEDEIASGKRMPPFHAVIPTVFKAQSVVDHDKLAALLKSIKDAFVAFWSDAFVVWSGSTGHADAIAVHAPNGIPDGDPLFAAGPQTTDRLPPANPYRFTDAGGPLHAGTLTIMPVYLGYEPCQLSPTIRKAAEQWLAVQRAKRPVQAEPPPHVEVPKTPTPDPPPPPEPIDEAPDTVRDPVPESGVREVGQKLVKYTPAFSAKAADIADKLGVKKPVLYTVGGKVSKKWLAQFVSAVGAQVVDESNALDTLRSGSVIFVGRSDAPRGKRHDLALRAMAQGAEALHIVLSEQVIVNASEYERFITTDATDYDGFDLSEWVEEQRQERAA